MSFIEQKIGGFGVIQKNKNGTINQIGLTEEQYEIFECFLKAISSEKPLIKLPKNFDLVPVQK